MNDTNRIALLEKLLDRYDEKVTTLENKLKDLRNLYEQNLSELLETCSEITHLKSIEINSSTIEEYNKQAPIHKDSISSDTKMDNYVKLLPLSIYLGFVHKITKLEAKIAKLRKAIEPFANAHQIIPDDYLDAKCVYEETAS